MDTFNVNFTENKTPGSERAIIIGTVDRDDDDGDDESDALIDVCYFIVGGSDVATKTFDLHPWRHELITVKVKTKRLVAYDIYCIKIWANPGLFLFFSSYSHHNSITI